MLNDCTRDGKFVDRSLGGGRSFGDEGFKDGILVC